MTVIEKYQQEFKEVINKANMTGAKAMVTVPNGRQIYAYPQVNDCTACGVERVKDESQS